MISHTCFSPHTTCLTYNSCSNYKATLLAGQGLTKGPFPSGIKASQAPKLRFPMAASTPSRRLLPPQPFLGIPCRDARSSLLYLIPGRLNMIPHKVHISGCIVTLEAQDKRLRRPSRTKRVDKKYKMTESSLGEI
ncbi:hypothetical protein KNP414_00205 [Paenibacillus mucilaginosus KNP414]|uniref:Uncharacterized protein n=1 Tax=Paenibacillus mucilaginosus (strain KNP414) TaxID=1036673 RepID=F8FKY8_PAEMK|nr:hypothetical protein KNP414_00205 [Paenibacillus mucilaginosus KNP414]